MRIPKLPLIITIVFVLGYSFFLVESGCKAKHEAPVDTSKGKIIYQCSMHPAIVSTQPGDCPICGMRLTRVEQSPVPTASAKKKILFYRHPMRADVTSMKPSKDEMGMDYIAVYEGEETGAADIKIPGHADVVISPERQQMIGVQTTEAAERALTLTIRAVGRVAYDPELYNTLTEYKEAVENQEKIKTSSLSGVRERGDALVKSAELKLKLLGINASDIGELLKADHSGSSLLLPESTAWIYADIYEYETGFVKAGQTAKVTSQAIPGAQFEGHVRTVDPILNAATRTLRVRITVPNTDKLLKPEMFVDVAIEIPFGVKLAIPEEALFNAGETQLVFVSMGEGRFEPRKVRAGYEVGGYYEILDGLKKGEKVVSSANFLIDSESRLRAAVKSFGGKKEE
ncbi:MAG: efflux RND transporter periplasmic adaptor subunit [Candidatus Omnitrophica bacterium]|nr:efflux RND transporter periplasmic adaptor subunit [Candidatus Omnitrophota bacterium]